jgi:hypothetical protein
MIRTQIYLTERRRDELAALAKTAGKKQSELIREAVDRLIAQSGENRRRTALREAAGMWKERTDLPDFASLRTEWDRT